MRDDLVKILDKDLEVLGKMTVAVSRIKNGEPQTVVMRDMGLNLMCFRNVFVSGKLSGYTKDDVSDCYDEEQNYFENAWYLPTLNWAERLFCVVAGTRKLSDVPLDVEKTMKKALKTLSYRERKVLRMRYHECMTLDEVGKILGVNRERVRQIEAKALRKMRRPNRLQYIKYGESWVKRQQYFYLETKKKQLQNILEECESLSEKIEQEKTKIVKECADVFWQDETEKNNSADVPITDLGLSIRSEKCLLRAALETTADLRKMSYSQATKIRNLGKKSLAEVVRRVEEVTGTPLPYDENGDII